MPLLKLSGCDGGCASFEGPLTDNQLDLLYRVLKQTYTELYPVMERMAEGTLAAPGQRTLDLGLDAYACVGSDEHRDSVFFKGPNAVRDRDAFLKKLGLMPQRGPESRL